jgi:hypothetical protein
MRLQALVGALLDACGFTPGQETSQARELWETAEREAPRMHTPFDQEWFTGVLAAHATNTAIWTDDEFHTAVVTDLAEGSAELPETGVTRLTP